MKTFAVTYNFSGTTTVAVEAETAEEARELVLGGEFYQVIEDIVRDPVIDNVREISLISLGV